jgi:hypothetical protein
LNRKNHKSASFPSSWILADMHVTSYAGSRKNFIYRAIGYYEPKIIYFSNYLK